MLRTKTKKNKRKNPGPENWQPLHGPPKKSGLTQTHLATISLSHRAPTVCLGSHTAVNTSHTEVNVCLSPQSKIQARASLDWVPAGLPGNSPKSKQRERGEAPTTSSPGFSEHTWEPTR